MFKYLFVLIMLLSSISFADEPLKIELEKSGRKLRICFINLSDKDILLNKWIIFGYYIGAIEYTVEVIDKEGYKIPFSHLLDRCPFKEDDILSLSPGCIIGREFTPEEIVNTHWITAPGFYKVRAIYKNREKQFADKGVYNVNLVTDWINFEVTEKTMEDAIGKDWRKVMQDALEHKRKAEEYQKKADDEYKKQKNRDSL